MFFGHEIGRSNFCHFLIISIAIQGHLVQEQLDFKFGLGILEIGYMPILVNLATLFLSKIIDWAVVFWSTCKYFRYSVFQYRLHGCSMEDDFFVDFVERINFRITSLRLSTSNKQKISSINFLVFRYFCCVEVLAYKRQIQQISSK